MWRSEDEMLEVVRRRAAAARDRRRALLTGSSAALLLVAALGTAAVRGGDGGGSQQVRVAAPPGGGGVAQPTTTLAAPQASAVLPPIDLQPALPATPAPNVPRATPSIRPGVTTTTPSTTVAPPPTTAARPAVCAPGEVTATATAAKPAFAAGEPVRLTGTLRNTSGRTCGEAGFGIAFSVKDASGTSVGADRAVSAIVDCSDEADCTWPAGAEETSPWCWDQSRTVAGVTGAAPPGRYTVTLTWSGRVTSPVSASVTVDVLPPPAGTTPPAATC